MKHFSDNQKKSHDFCNGLKTIFATGDKQVSCENRFEGRLANKETLVRGLMANGSTGSPDCEMVKFKVLREGTKTNSGRESFDSEGIKKCNAAVGYGYLAYWKCCKPPPIMKLVSSFLQPHHILDVADFPCQASVSG